MSKHTALPWDIHHTAIGLEIHPLSDENGIRTLADVCQSSRISREESEANARLIVTAVNCHDEMLAALEYTREQIPLPKDILCAIDSAIAKARGEGKS